MWCQAIIWIFAGTLLIGPLRINFSDILIEIHTFPFKKMHLKMLSGKWRPFCFSLNVLNLKVLSFTDISIKDNSVVADLYDKNF